MLLGRCSFMVALVLILFLGIPKTVLAQPFWFAQTSSTDHKAKALAHYMMAICLELNNKPQEAVQEYEQSVKFATRESAPRLRLATYYIRFNQLDKAVAQLQTILRLDATVTQAHYLLALVYSTQQKFDQAALEYEAVLKQASQNNPENIEIFTYLGQLYFAQHKLNQAIDQFSKILKIEPQHSSVWYFLGLVYLEAQERDKAMHAFLKALEYDSKNSEVLNSVAYMYAEDGLYLDEAEKLIRQAIDINPANGAYYDTLGWVLYKKGLYSQSLMVLQKAQTYVEDSVLYEHIGDVYRVLNQPAMALKSWQRAYDLAPHQVTALKKIKELEKWTASHSSHLQN